MKTFFKVLILMPLVLISSCRSDDAETDQVTDLASKTYTLNTVDNSGISGTVRFIKNSNFTLSIELRLLGTVNNNYHSGFLYMDNAANNGEDVAITLDVVDGDTGMSTTVFTSLDDDTPISYEELLNFDGYVEVKSNDVNLNTPVANVDIGQNELTTNQVTYNLEERNLNNASGIVTFKERLNGEALAVFSLTGTPASGEHPAFIRSGNMATASGATIFTFNNIKGITVVNETSGLNETRGVSQTNVAELDNGTAFMYSDVIAVDGYIDVELSTTNTLLIAQGNIGSN
ncbi:hypothetical protein [Lacinutrix algicola]|uniref:hypothetical protein n=1 Tax=Lacinutrix algicola TaxID=342954 RepID=UPI0006E18486|nr:hypothetical protein [Lacinutrix algicola]